MYDFESSKSPSLQRHCSKPTTCLHHLYVLKAVCRGTMWGILCRCHTCSLRFCSSKTTARRRERLCPAGYGLGGGCTGLGVVVLIVGGVRCQRSRSALHAGRGPEAGFPGTWRSIRGGSGDCDPVGTLGTPTRQGMDTSLQGVVGQDMLARHAWTSTAGPCAVGSFLHRSRTMTAMTHSTAGVPLHRAN